MAKRLSNRDMLTALYEKFCGEKSNPFDNGGKVNPVNPVVIPDNWQSEPPPGRVYDDAQPPKGSIWVYNPQTGERKSIPACEGSL